jgi:WD40 repeat protein
MLAIGTHDGRVRLVEVSTGRERHNVMTHSDFVRGVALSLCGTMVASVGNDFSCKVFDAETSAEVLSVPGHTGRGACLCQVDERGKCAAVDELCPVDGHASEVVCVAFAPCGRRIATGGVDKTVLVHNVRQKEVERRLVGHSGPVFSVAVSAGGGMLVSGSRDRSILIWDLAEGLVIRGIPDAHEMYVHAVAVSPCGATLASAGGDTLVKMWDAETVAPLRTFTGHAHFVLTVAPRARALGRVQFQCHSTPTSSLCPVVPRRALPHSMSGAAPFA